VCPRIVELEDSGIHGRLRRREYGMVGNLGASGTHDGIVSSTIVTTNWPIYNIAPYYVCDVTSKRSDSKT